MTTERIDVLAELSAVLQRHGASLYFGAPAVLWVDGKELGEVWQDEDGDGSEIVPVDPDLFAAALARVGGAV